MEGRAATPASDVFSFHVIMVEVLTGARPHDGKTPGQIESFVLGRKTLALPSDAELAKRWAQLVAHASDGGGGGGSGGAPPPPPSPSPNAALMTSPRVAHKPLPGGDAAAQVGTHAASTRRQPPPMCLPANRQPTPLPRALTPRDPRTRGCP